MIYRIVFLVIALTITSVQAEVISTAKGRVLSTQGHNVPSCRTVTFRENGQTAVLRFRIQDSAGDDDVNSVILAAMMADRDVAIAYNETITSGCGTEPRIAFITVF